MQPPPVLILAAGRSTRMRGRDKLAERIGDQPLLRRQALVALEVSDRVLVTLPAPDHPRAAFLAGLPVTILTPPEAAEGLSGSLRAGVAALPACDRFLVLLADLPELTAADLQRVISAASTDPAPLIWRGATEDGSPGHPILFDASLRPEFVDLSGDTGGAPLLARHRGQTRLVPLPGQRARHDLDTPEDWAAWRNQRGEGAHRSD